MRGQRRRRTRRQSDRPRLFRPRVGLQARNRWQNSRAAGRRKVQTASRLAPHVPAERLGLTRRPIPANAQPSARSYEMPIESSARVSGHPGWPRRPPPRVPACVRGVWSETGRRRCGLRQRPSRSPITSVNWTHSAFGVVAGLRTWAGSAVGVMLGATLVADALVAVRGPGTDEQDRASPGRLPLAQPLIAKHGAQPR
jgi:hypothetical protein